ncbi:MAG: carboxynorspermidine decarboxylase [Muribaculaceae bacterium]|nr:carboxynorspermidine decarboxylase [Muribaculaceae bacterium]
MKTPYYIVYESRLRHNLDLITSVARESGAHIIMAFKANALWRTFGVMREYNEGFTASSLYELRLGNEELLQLGHSYCPAYTEETIQEYLEGSSHITFNSLSQFERFIPEVVNFNTSGGGHKVTAGLRVNPQCSVIETDIYNPALPGSRFGVTADKLEAYIAGERKGEWPEGLDGFHFHQLCESSSYDLEKVLTAFEEQFGCYLTHLKWVNFGGGHLMTREGYDTAHLVKVIRGFRERYPWLEVILEPGSAFTWRTGDLITSVVDVVENHGIRTAIIDASFACHMPDTLEMPYQPAITESNPEGGFVYRLGGNSCLSGDFMGDWHFDHPLQEGEQLTLEDMNHYTTVKTNMFNGIAHPAIIFERTDGSRKLLRKFDFDDYKNRMD